ncbi:hypothetical protein [Nostoc favosum]|uniref:Uncharacterized protein n=1 Tax=Nostoc favosum CHAB5714 TaxID=2780399 RepID=A0ABS8IIT0_9NOSO|nr:hypothetical protein [Nostoc favosum]MCC5603705.1 hypothetical protein [Nostoc favosum CHAB5714]
MGSGDEGDEEDKVKFSPPSPLSAASLLSPTPPEDIAVPIQMQYKITSRGVGARQCPLVST